jgi:signal transduction histidine kinase
VESAVYFAVSELLTNVTKHAAASRASIDVAVVGSGSAARLRVEVRDDGVGGADPAVGSGMAGIARRLAVFDGTLDVASPTGGPTVVTLTMPWSAAGAAPPVD